MDLIKVGENTYYIKNATNIGIYKINDHDVYLIDTGNDKECGKKILKIINEQNWQIKGIISTHFHADHIGGNEIIQNRTGCEVLAHQIDGAICSFPILEPTILYGGYPFKGLCNKFLLAKGSNTKEIENNLPKGLEYINLKGHSFSMVGIKTSDDIYFLADSLANENIINKYHLFFLYDVQEYLNTLDFLSTLKGNLFILSHGDVTNNIDNLIKINRNEIAKIIHKLIVICHNPLSLENIIKKIFEDYHLLMNENQYVLLSSTIKSYLAYLINSGKMIYEFKDNIMLYKSI